MSFTLKLDPPVPSHHSQHPDVCYPGQTVHGTLIYVLPKQRTLNSVSLSLRGKLQTDYIETRSATGAGLTHGPRRPMREVIRLFEDTRKLFDGPYDVPAQKFEWKFEFLIPRYANVDRSGVSSGIRGGNKGFIDDGYGDLPPSFEWNDQTMIHTASAKIRYKFVARAESSGLFGTDEKEWPIEIRRVSDFPDPELISVQKDFPPVSWSSQKLRSDGEKLGYRQRLRSVVSSDPGLNSPSINFHAWILMPRCFSGDQKFNVDFSVTYERSGDLDPEKPSLFLESMRLSLKARTQIMVKRGGFVGMTISGDRQCEGRNIIATEVLKLSDGGKGVALPIDGSVVKVGETCVGDWRNGEGIDFLGDFVTWIVRYGYWLNVQAVVKHGESGKRWNLDTGFTVQLRDEYVPELADGDHEQYGDMLPAYEDDVQPPELEIEYAEVGEGSGDGRKSEDGA